MDASESPRWWPLSSRNAEGASDAAAEPLHVPTVQRCEYRDPVVYAALGVLFFLLAVELQVVAGFGALAAGTALLPITIIMLFLSSAAGHLAERIGPRLPMTLGPCSAGIGSLLLLRIGPETSYATDVLPAVVVIGLGLALTVAPLTATVLAAAEDRHAGIASGVNNAVARAGGLLAVAAIPVLVGLTGDAYANPTCSTPGSVGP